jgi:CRP/FNR family cyclic AMP-dependent transcriptional regulator
MKERFEGETGKGRLVEALGNQELIRGNLGLAERLSKVVIVENYPKSSVLFEQNKFDTDLFFILIGGFVLSINGDEFATRKANEALGEIVATEPDAKRMVQAVAQEDSVVARVNTNTKEFEAIVKEYPEVWKNIARVLGNRLRQTTRLVHPAKEFVDRNAQRHATRIFLSYIGVWFAIWLVVAILTWYKGGPSKLASDL